MLYQNLYFTRKVINKLNKLKKLKKLKLKKN